MNSSAKSYKHHEPKNSKTGLVIMDGEQIIGTTEDLHTAMTTLTQNSLNHLGLQRLHLLDKQYSYTKLTLIQSHLVNREYNSELPI